jgi:hypothetical protein
MLLHHCLLPSSGPNNDNIRRYLQFVTRDDSDMYQMSRWIDHNYVDLPLKLTLGLEHGRDGVLKNLEGARYIIESILKHKPRSSQGQQTDTGLLAKVLQRQRGCADVLTVDVLQALVSLAPKLAVNIFKQLELDRVYPNKTTTCHVPRILDLNDELNTSFLVAASSDWDPGIAWKEEFALPRSMVRQQAWRHSQSKFMCDVEPFVCGIKGLLDVSKDNGITKGIGLLHTICRNPALFDIFETESIRVLIKFHWSSSHAQLVRRVYLEAFLHVVNMGFYIVWAFSVPGTRLAWIPDSGEYQIFQHHPDSCGVESCRQRASWCAVFVAIYTALLLVYEVMVDWAEARMISSENTPEQHHGGHNFSQLNLMRTKSADMRHTKMAAMAARLVADSASWESLSFWDKCLYCSILVTACSLLDWGVSGSVRSWAVSLNLILMTARILSFMRAVDQLAPLVHMIVAVFGDMKQLLAVLFVFLLGFSLCFYFELSVFYDSTQSFDSYGRSTLSTFQMVLGEQDPTGQGVVLRTWTGAGLFFMLSVIGPVVLLNLVIAKISSTYEHTMGRIEVLRWQGKAQMVVAQAAFDNARRLLGKCGSSTQDAAQPEVAGSKWLHVLKPLDGAGAGAAAAEEEAPAQERVLAQVACSWTPPSPLTYHLPLVTSH